MSERLLTKDEVAARLTISARTVLELAARRELACVRIGRCVRFEPVDVEAFRVSRRCQAEAPVTAPAYVPPSPFLKPRKDWFA